MGWSVRAAGLLSSVLSWYLGGRDLRFEIREWRVGFYELRIGE